MKWVLIAIALSFVSVFAPLYYVFGEDALQDDPLLLQQMSLSQQVRSALQGSKQSIQKAEDSFSLLVKQLQDTNLMQSEELMTLSNSLTDTTNSFKSASIALEQSNWQVEQEKQQNRTLNKWLWRLIITLAVWIGIKIIRVIVGLKWPILDKLIPRWVDILI
jgi:septal ring factor EnvC (AmiA/AmiB activator)